jgi:hypothetical protein
MDKYFVRIVDTQKRVRILNIRQIVQISQGSDGWQVSLTAGDRFILDASTAEQLIKHLPGANPATASGS